MIGATAGSAVPALRFTAGPVDAVRAAAVPTLRLPLRIACDAPLPIRGLGLNVEVRIAAERRRYTAEEGTRLAELFGAPELWSRSLGAVPWVRTACNVPPFDGEATVAVDLPCSYDFEVAAAKYLAALDDGEIPVDVLLTGNVFYSDAGRLQTVKLPWDHDLGVRIPVAVWRAAVDAVFPGSAWLRLDRAVLKRLQAHRARSGFTSWDETFAALLAAAEG